MIQVCKIEKRVRAFMVTILMVTLCLYTTFSYAWTDCDKGTDEFIYNDRVCSFAWDCIPLGILLDVDGVEHGYVLKSKSSGVSIPTEWQKARVLRGLFGEGCGGPADGTVEVKCGKANKKGIAKVSMKITLFDGRKLSYPSTAVDVAHDGDVRVEWQRQKYHVEISGNEFSGEPIYGNIRPACAPNAVWSEDVGGKIPDGSHYVLTSDCAPVYWGRVFWWQQKDLSSRLWDIFTSGCYCINDDLAMPLLCEQPFAVRNGKIDFGRKPSLKYKKIGGRPLLTGMDDAKPNIPGTKITYNAKTGIFKGSFTLYTDPYNCCEFDNGRVFQLKKYSFKITGVVISGGRVFGAGTATCKKPEFSCSIFMQDVSTKH